MKEIKCHECKKIVGEYVYQRSMTVKGLGTMPVYDCKYDYRKASHISFGEGLICKGCARKFFPEGVAYKVTNDYHGKRITPYVGIKQTGLFASRKDAQAAADACNRRNLSNRSRVDEVRA